jgi:hypothetical protein
MRLRRADAIARASATLDEQQSTGQWAWAPPPPGRKILAPRSQLARAPTIKQLALAAAQQDHEEAAAGAHRPEAATKRVKSSKSGDEESLPPATARPAAGTTNAEAQPSTSISGDAQATASTAAAPVTRIWGPVTVVGSDVLFAVPQEPTEPPPHPPQMPASHADASSRTVCPADAPNSLLPKYIESAHSQSPPPPLRHKAPKPAAAPANDNTNTTSTNIGANTHTTAKPAKAAEEKAAPHAATTPSASRADDDGEGQAEQRLWATSQLANQKLKFVPKNVQRRPPEDRGSTG